MSDTDELVLEPQRKLSEDFFTRDPVLCASELIGCIFVWGACAGKIVETEAYNAVGDPACHTWARPSARQFVAKYGAGTAYVYLNYGVHWLFNVLIKGESHNGFVLFRAVEPLAGIDLMRSRRRAKYDYALASGPGKLTKAFGVDGRHHGKRFLHHKSRGIFSGEPTAVATGVRIGISQAQNFLWRFADPTSPAISAPI